MGRLMSDAEIRRRKKAQGHVSQATGALGLAAVGGTLAASRGGRTALRKVPQLKSRVAAPKPKDPNRDRISGAVTPVLATSAGLGGASAFNFAAYTNAESRKRKPTTVVTKELGMEMGYYGEVGHPVKLPEIKVPIEKAWQPVASNFDSERSRHKRAKTYESGALVGAGAGGAYAASQGTKAVQAAKKVKAPEVSTVVRDKAGKPSASTAKANIYRAVPTKELKALGRHGGKAAVGVAGVAAAAGAHGALKRKRKGSWQSYAKRDAESAFGIDHTEWTAP